MSIELIFVYNANSGLGNALLDTFHKLLSPSTYPCSLCGITYGATRMRPEWRDFLKSLPFPTHFIYRDQLPDTYPALIGQPLPAVFVKNNDGSVVPLITAVQMQRLDLSSLIGLLQQRLAEATDFEINRQP
jgi:hypothetical protein